MIAGDGEDGRAEAVQEQGRPRVLFPLSAMRDIAGGDDDVRPDSPDEIVQRAFDLGRVPGADMEVGDVDQAGRHSRGRLSAGLAASWVLAER